MTKDDQKSNIMCNSSEEEFELRRGPWTLEEDNLLIHYIACHGEGRWNLLAKCAGLKRTGKSCRLRWLNYLKPDIKRGNLTPQEQLLILELHSRWGNRWSKIAQYLPGRTDNEIKNYWRTRVQKQARQLNVDVNSKTFLEAIKCFWMPRLLEKMEQSSSYSNSSMSSFSYSNSSMSSSSSSSLSSSSSVSTMENQDSAFGSLPANHGILIPSSAKPRKLMDTSNDKKEKYSNSSNCSNSFSSDSEIRVVKLPEIDENQTNSAQTCRINGCCNSIHGDCYHVDITCYSAECFSQQAMLAMGSQDLFMPEYQMPEADWFNDEVAGTFWNTDELWQFRKAEEAWTVGSSHNIIPL